LEGDIYLDRLPGRRFSVVRKKKGHKGRRAREAFEINYDVATGKERGE